MKMNLYEIVFFYYCLVHFYVNGTVQDRNEATELRGLDIKGFIDKLIYDFKEKIPAEITFSDQNILLPQFLDEYISGSLDLRDISFTGLKEFNTTIDYGPMIPIPKHYSITIEYLSWFMNYKSDITVYDTKYLSIFGEGSAKITLRNLKIEGDIFITIIPMGAKITVDIDWDGITFEVSGLLEDDIFSTLTSDFVGSTVTNVSENFKQPLSFIFNKIANAIIKLMSSYHYRTFKNETNMEVEEHILNNKYVVNEKKQEHL